MLVVGRSPTTNMENKDSGDGWGCAPPVPTHQFSPTNSLSYLSEVSLRAAQRHLGYEH